jgi:hypothetical protein
LFMFSILYSLFVPCCGTFWAFLWHKSKILFVPSGGTFCAFMCQELQVKNCKSRIVSQELQI